MLPEYVHKYHHRFSSTNTFVNLRSEVQELKLEVKQLTALTMQFLHKREDFTKEESGINENNIPTKPDNVFEDKNCKNVPPKSKFKCDECECSFKK